MNVVLVGEALLKYGPSIIPLLQQVTAWIKGGKTEVTADDVALLVTLSNKSADDYLKEAKVTRQGSASMP